MSFLICGFVIAIVAAVDPDADAVVFPGWGTYNFKTYSGYIPVGTGLR
jgi:serine carboxypeptidase-like clade 2